MSLISSPCSRAYIHCLPPTPPLRPRERLKNRIAAFLFIVLYACQKIKYPQSILSRKAHGVFSTQKARQPGFIHAASSGYIADCFPLTFHVLTQRIPEVFDCVHSLIICPLAHKIKKSLIYFFVKISFSRLTLCAVRHTLHLTQTSKERFYEHFEDCLR